MSKYFSNVYFRLSLIDILSSESTGFNIAVKSERIVILTLKFNKSSVTTIYNQTVTLYSSIHANAITNNQKPFQFIKLYCAT